MAKLQKKLDKSDLNYSVRRVQTMVNDRDDSELDTMWAWMENAWRSNWSLPSELVAEDVEWVHRVTSTDPHDAVRTGARSLSTFMPKVTLYPLMANQESREVANSVEKALQWQFRQASERREVKVLHDIVLSAILYDEVIASVWYLPEQIKVLKKWGMDHKRMVHARRYGDYIIKVHNPRDTIMEYSDLMAERVVFRSVVPVQEVVDYWGDRASELAWMSEQEAHQDKEYVTLYDYSEIGQRTVFAYLTEDENFVNDLVGQNPVEIMNEKVPYDFLPVAGKIGGTSLANEGEYQRIPLLWSVYNAGQWETQNIVETLLVSEGLAYSVSPRYAVENEYDNDEVVDMDFREPARIVNLKRGQKLQDLRPPALNEGLNILSQRIESRMDKSTVPRFLQSGEVSGSFSGMNLQSQAGMKSLAPYKLLAESALAEVFTIMLYWIHYSGEPLVSYVPKKNIVKRDEFGNPTVDVNTEKITVGGKDSFDVENLYIEVKLQEDAPSDYVAKINAGAMMVERLGYPYSKALEFVGETDPETAIELRTQEERRLAEREAGVQEIINETSLEMMQLRQELESNLMQVQEMIAQLEPLLQQAQQGQGGGPEQVPGQMPGEPAPDGSVDPQAQALLAQSRPVGGAGPGLPVPPGQPGGEAIPSPQLPTNPAEGDIPPIQGAPGVGLREEQQLLEGE